MKVTGKYFVNVTAQMGIVPDHNPELKIDENGVVSVKVYEGEKPYWVQLSALKDQRDAWKFMVQKLISELQWAYQKAGLSKAEMKRELIKNFIISK